MLANLKGLHHSRLCVHFVKNANYASLLATELTNSLVNDKSTSSCQICLPTITVEPRYNEGPRDWQSLFAMTSFFFVYSNYWGKENCMLYREFATQRLYRGSTVHQTISNVSNNQKQSLKNCQANKFSKTTIAIRLNE